MKISSFEVMRGFEFFSKSSIIHHFGAKNHVFGRFRNFLDLNWKNNILNPLKIFIRHFNVKGSTFDRPIVLIVVFSVWSGKFSPFFFFITEIINQVWKITLCIKEVYLLKRSSSAWTVLLNWTYMWVKLSSFLYGVKTLTISTSL